MPENKFKSIYQCLRANIDSGKYNDTMMLPTEMKLIKEFDCSRNTVRRAIEELAKEGYVKSVHGKGVIILERNKVIELTLNELTTIKELGLKNDEIFTTSVINFSKISINEELSNKTGLKLNSKAYNLHRIIYVNDEAMILDINFFDANIVKNLSVQIAQDSIYEYIENTLNIKILTSKKIIVVEHATELDKRYLNLGTFDCVVVVKNFVYTDSGKLFEYTESRHNPDKFIFVENNTIRTK